MADGNASSKASSNTMMTVAHAIGETLPHHEGVGYIVIAVEFRTGNIGWVSQIPTEQVTEILGNIVASKVN